MLTRFWLWNFRYIKIDPGAAAWQAAYARFFDPTFAATAIADRRTRWHKLIADDAETIILAALDGRPLVLSRSVAPPRGQGSRKSTAATAPQSRRFYTKCGFIETGDTRMWDYGDGNPLHQVEYQHPA